MKEIRFDIWCTKCRHGDKSEHEDPCDECLETPAREESTKPVKFEEK